ncbi:FG-GAP-like repeat-containing protein [Flavobacterium sp. N1736]|uniref:FG-GAP-like repeat-containing protein n=1 Tax=Flavobacterium sp. N1736 TaxID=2986823 RepID=UPI002224EDCD|nr:FG-GAP-like repeat-containing protein [Flavobacterium sp. N1736]
MTKLYISFIFFSFSFFINAQIVNKSNGGITLMTKLESDEGNRINLSNKSQNNAVATASAPTGSSAEVGNTEGELSVSSTGSANYEIPLFTPTGINKVAPKVSLAYNSQGGNGSAAFGWNITGVSSITRIPASKFHDGTIDPVDFNALDRFALDGQRLIVKNGTSGVYGANGTVYETEFFSNIKVTSYGVHPAGAAYGPSYFVVEYPDGSTAQYGNTSYQYGSSHESRSLSDWSITNWQNAQNIRINYLYALTNNVLRITEISYGGVGDTGDDDLNTIQFTYKDRQIPIQYYIGNTSFTNSKMLDKIWVNSFSAGVRRYELISNSADQITSITEKNGDSTKAYNPTVFTYNTTSQTITGSTVTASLSVGNLTASNSTAVSGDFNGDGSMDFILYLTTGTDTKKKYWLFSDINTTSAVNIGFRDDIGLFDEIFPVSFINASNKLDPMQGWTIVQGGSFTTYALNSGMKALQNQKNYVFPRFVLDYYYECDGGESFKTKTNQLQLPPPPTGPIAVHYETDIARAFVNGDFNGDGLTDIIAVEKPFTYPYTYGCTTGTSTYAGGKTYFVNLDSRITSGFVTTAGYITITSTSKFMTADFNGDGKSDLYVFDTGKVKVYTLDNNNQFVLLYQTITADASIALDKPILMGDYNGDGKNDFIIPKGSGYSEWYKYSATGSGLVKEIQTYTGFTYPTSSATTTYYVIPTDYNNDGKTDLLLTSSSRGSGSSVGSLNVTCYLNKNGSFSNAAGNYFSGSIINQADIYNNALPVFLSANEPNGKLELSFINNNRIFTFNSTKDFNKEQLLRTITAGNGVTESITYQPLGPDSFEEGGSYYFSGIIENYPNINVLEAPTFQLVTKLERASSTSYKKQLFTYYDAVSNMEGLGFLGFRATLRTNWFSDSSPISIISNVSKNDISLRGINVENYTSIGFLSPSEATSDTYITKDLLGYNSQLLANKVLKLQNTSIKQYNGLLGTSTETAIVYNDNNNPLTATILRKEGASVVETVVEGVSQYDNLTSPYIVDRVQQKYKTTTVSGSSTGYSEIYEFDSNQLLSYTEKYVYGPGSDGAESINEANVYDSFGNLKTKTITSGLDSPRVLKFEYDTSGRFLTKSTDYQNLSTIFDYNFYSGALNSETNPFGLKTTYAYDTWFKKIKVTDYLGKSKNYTYANSGSEIIITTTGDDGSASKDIFNDLGLKIMTGVKNINGVYSMVSYLYDLYERNVQISEPYGDEPQDYNTTVFDNYGRVSKSMYFTGNIVNYTYSGLTTTISENTKTKIITKNALGNIVSLSETPGGSINYTYFANGNLKSSNFDGAVTSIEQDGWGRRTKITDPSAGIFTYEYNNFGEVTKEIAPNGTTTYTLTPDGRISQKLVSGLYTNSKTTYTYDGTSNLLLNSKFENLSEGTSTITNAYTYDTSKRINQMTETTPYGSFTKNFSYDAFGRAEIETSTAVISSKTSTKAFKNTYKNGYSWQILDNANNAVLWQTNTVNPKGQLTGGLYGPITMTNTFDYFGYPSQIKYDKTTVPVTNILTLGAVFDPIKGNTNSKSNNLLSWNESFKYDTLDRLTEFTNPSGAQETQAYDAKGRITQNNLGTYIYSNTSKPYQNTSINVTADALTYYTSKPVLNVTYNTFNSPVQIEEAGIDKVSFLYNDSNSRSTMFYGGLQDDKTLRPYRKHYSSDGTIEAKENKTTGAVEFITYIGGNAYNAGIVLKSDGTTQNYLFLQRDYQGSVIAISDASGAVVEKRLFDAWGNIVKVQNGAGTALTGLTLLERGYTGHEHIQSVGIINMNGRIYDPKIHRFLQPDDNIQEPFNIQNYNRYGYVLNSPLKYTDPSGEIFGTLFTIGKNILKHGVNTDHYDYKEIKNAFRIDMGMFKRNFGQILSRFTWGSTNSIIGNIAAHGYNLTGNVEGVTYLAGATAIETKRSGSKAFTLGSYINGPQGFKADWHDHLFVHEYGHTIQSSYFGPLYIPVIAVTSLTSTLKLGGDDHEARWFEVNASKLGAKYIDKHYGSGKEGYTPNSPDYFDLKTFQEGGYSPYENPRNSFFNGRDPRWQSKHPTSGGKFTWWDVIIPSLGLGI